jgi:hypothetical protein
MNPLRKVFIEKHQEWIDFLNWQPFITPRVAMVDTISLTVIDDYFSKGELEYIQRETQKAYQIWNHSPFDMFALPDVILEGYSNPELLKQQVFFCSLMRQTEILREKFSTRFNSELELLYTVRDWMRNNLKAIGASGKSPVYDNRFTRADLNKIMQRMYLHIAIDGEIQYVNSRNNKSIVTALPSFLLPFLTYTREAIQNNAKRKPGFFKIGVCPYKKLRDNEECGLVFIGETNGQFACKKHTKKWRELKHLRKKFNAFDKKH